MDRARIVVPNRVTTCCAPVNDVSLPGQTVEVMRRMSHVWPGQYWPMSAQQEKTAVAELRRRAGKPSAFDRDDVSAMVGILRCGAEWDRVLELAPGLDGGLRKSRKAWKSIVTQPTSGSLLRNASQAALVLPVPVHRALFVLEDSPELLAHEVAIISEQVEEYCRATLLVEAELRKYSPPSNAGMSVGARLFSSTRPGAYADPFFLAERVTALSPVRVAELLGTPLA